MLGMRLVMVFVKLTGSKMVNKHWNNQHHTIEKCSEFINNQVTTTQLKCNQITVLNCCNVHLYLLVQIQSFHYSGTYSEKYIKYVKIFSFYKSFYFIKLYRNKNPNCYYFQKVIVQGFPIQMHRKLQKAVSCCAMQLDVTHSLEPIILAEPRINGTSFSVVI